MVLEKTLESPLACKEIQPVHPKGNQSWIFIGRTYAEAETPILWPSDVKNQLIGKDPDAGKDWRWEEKGMTEDETVGWHHQLNGHEFELNSRSWWWTGRPGCAAVHGVAKRRTWLSDWTELNWSMGRFMNLGSSKYFLGIGTWFFPERCLCLRACSACFPRAQSACACAVSWIPFRVHGRSVTAVAADLIL